MVKVSKDPQTSKNVRKVLRKGIPMSPIEELTTPVQMERLEPWIKRIYGQTKLTTGTFSGPLKADSQYNNREEHQPISDWSARVNKEYYDNMIDTSLEWGEFNEPGAYGGLANKTHPIWYPDKPRRRKKPAWKPMPWQERYFRRRDAYREAIRNKYPFGQPSKVKSFYEEFWDLMDYLRQFKNDYRWLDPIKVKRRIGIIKNKIEVLWSKSGQVSLYYRQVLTELRDNIWAVIESQAAVIRNVSVRLFLICLVIFMVSSAFMALSN